MYARNDNGTIKFHSNIPMKWQDDFAFGLRGESKHKAAGFYPVVEPVLTETQRKGVIYFDAENEVFTYEVVELTPEEINQRELNKLNSDVSQQTIDLRKSDGQIGYDRIVAIIERKYRKGEITASQAISALQYFDPLIEPLNRGQWILVQLKMNSATVPAGYQPLFDEIKSKVDAYVSESY